MRCRIQSYYASPRFQYRECGKSEWFDAPAFISTFRELKAFLFGKFHTSHLFVARQIKDMRETYTL